MVSRVWTIKAAPFLDFAGETWRAKNSKPNAPKISSQENLKPWSLCLRLSVTGRVARNGFFVGRGCCWCALTNQVMRSFLWGSCKSQQCTPATESKLPIPRQSSQGRTCQVVDSSGWDLFFVKTFVNAQQNGMMEPLASPSKKNPRWGFLCINTLGSPMILSTKWQMKWLNGWQPDVFQANLIHIYIYTYIYHVFSNSQGHQKKTNPISSWAIKILGL